jgi:hypothetical protein
MRAGNPADAHAENSRRLCALAKVTPQKLRLARPEPAVPLGAYGD